MIFGFCGGTGAGKSTFGNLLLGLLDPTSGCIKINETIINSKDKINGWQKNISFVPQNLFLLTDYLYNFLSYSPPWAF